MIRIIHNTAGGWAVLCIIHALTLLYTYVGCFTSRLSRKTCPVGVGRSLCVVGRAAEVPREGANPHSRPAREHMSTPKHTPLPMATLDEDVATTAPKQQTTLSTALQVGRLDVAAMHEKVLSHLRAGCADVRKVRRCLTTVSRVHLTASYIICINT